MSLDLSQIAFLGERSEDERECLRVECRTEEFGPSSCPGGVVVGPGDWWGARDAEDERGRRRPRADLHAAWTGERLPDGRPKVPDDILQRMKNVSIEEAWAVLRNEGYRNQFEGGWQILHQDVPVVGRALTAQYMPTRPDVKKMIDDGGKAEGRIGSSNSWPIDMLQKGDVYVADGFGKIVDGTLIGDNLGNSIYAKSGNGVVFDGSVRDIEGLGGDRGIQRVRTRLGPVLHPGGDADGDQRADPDRPGDLSAGGRGPGQAGRRHLHPGPPGREGRQERRGRSCCATASAISGSRKASTPPARSTADGPRRSGTTSSTGSRRT